MGHIRYLEVGTPAKNREGCTCSSKIRSRAPWSRTGNAAAAVEQAVPIGEILKHLGEPTKPPCIHPPRASPQPSDDHRTADLEEHFTQDHFDYEFDQTVSW
jgi:hypothetical protein